ncbi:hypothetical protein Tco_1354541 [Tanacetum coccineum]
MSSITAQQAKFNLELVPKEKRLEIGKCNGRLNPGKTQREPTFQVVLDALALTPCYSAFLTTADVLEVYMHHIWDSIQNHDTSYRFRMDKKKKFYLNLETFRDIFQIFPRVHGQYFDELPTDEVIESFFKELGHTGEINPEMRETKTYKTYLGYAIGVTPPKKAQKFKKPSSPKLSIVPKKEKMIIEKQKGIELLSEVALTEEAQYEEVCKKSLMDFHKTHPSGSGIVTKIAPSAAKIKPSVTNEGTGAKPGVPNMTEEESIERSDSEHETDENEIGSESNQEENEEEVEDDEEEKDDEFVKTPSNYT